MNSHFKPAERLKRLKTPGIALFFSVARGMPDVIDLSVGEPDFAPPKRAFDAALKVLRSGETHYAPTNGVPELREALAQKMRHEYDLRYDASTEILITVGATEAIFLSLMGLFDQGDEVLVPSPGFVLYESGVQLTGGVPKAVPLLERNGFKPRARDVMSRITEKTRAMIINYPNNPTGAVLSHDEAAAIAKLAVERDIIVISDEVYEKIVYDDACHQCLATFPGMRERTLVVNSFSKTYAMTGFRVGYVCGPEELVSSLQLVHQHTATSVDTISQYAALAALNDSDDFVDDMVEEFDRRRRLVHSRLNEIEGVRCTLPGGAFYVFPSIENFGMSSERFAKLLAKEGHVAVVPGSAFGEFGEGYVRISYSAAYQQLEEALDRIEKATKKLK